MYLLLLTCLRVRLLRSMMMWVPQVMWLDVSMDNQLYRELYGAHRALIDEAVWAAWSRGELPAGIVGKGVAS